MIALLAKLIPLVQQLRPVVAEAVPIITAIVAALVDYYAGTGGVASGTALAVNTGLLARARAKVRKLLAERLAAVADRIKPQALAGAVAEEVEHSAPDPIGFEFVPVMGPDGKLRGRLNRILVPWPGGVSTWHRLADGPVLYTDDVDGVQIPPELKAQAEARFADLAKIAAKCEELEAEIDAEANPADLPLRRNVESLRAIVERLSKLPRTTEHHAQDLPLFTD